MQTKSSHRKYALPSNPDPVKPTEDDTRIMLETFRNDIIDSAAVYAMFPNRSQQGLRARLRKLAHNQYLHRLKQIEEVFVRGGGSLPIAYTLGAKGAERLREFHNLKPQRQQRAYRERAKRLSNGFIFHAIEQTRFLVSLRGEVSTRDDFEFLYPDEIYRRYTPNILKRDTLPSVVRSSVIGWHGHPLIEGTRPDGFFQLINKRKPEGKQRRNIFLEIDRGNETVAPSLRTQKSLAFWKSSSLLRKFVVYHFAQKNGVHKKDFGIPVFQALTVTTNTEHIEKMQEAIQSFLAGKPHHTKAHWFLFTDFQTIKSHKNLLDVPLVDASGKQWVLSDA